MRIIRHLFGRTLTFHLWQAFWGDIVSYLPLPPQNAWRLYFNNIRRALMLFGWVVLCSLPMIWGFFFLLVIISIVIGGTLRGAAAAALTASAVNHERRGQRMDLLGVTPIGLLGVGWALGQREFRLTGFGSFINRYIQNAQQIISVGLLIMLIMMSMGTLFFQFEGIASGDGNIKPMAEYILEMSLLTGCVAAWLFTDNAQSPLIGTIVGIWSGLITRRKPDAAGMGLAVFAVLQAVLFTAAVFIYNLNGLDDRLKLAIPILLMIAGREIMLRILWQFLCQFLNASGAELDAGLRL